MLMQETAQGMKPVAFFSQPFKGGQLRYLTGDKELAAIYFSVKYFKVYLEGNRFVVYTDASSRVKRWIDFLQYISFTVKYIPGMENVVPDFFSRLHLPIKS